MAHIAIIGAGPSGLAAARNLQRFGIPWTGYELAGGVGGLWDINGPRSTVYESAHPRAPCAAAASTLLGAQHGPGGDPGHEGGACRVPVQVGTGEPGPEPSAGQLRNLAEGPLRRPAPASHGVPLRMLHLPSGGSPVSDSQGRKTILRVPHDRRVVGNTWGMNAPKWLLVSTPVHQRWRRNA